MRRISAILFATTTLVALAAAPAGAQDASETSDVYVVHAIPGQPVDVYVNGDPALEDFQPEAIEGPIVLPESDYQIEVYPAGADPETTEPVIDVSTPLPGGVSASAVAHLTADGEPTLSVFVNDLSPIDEGNGRLAIRHVAAAPPVDIIASGAPVEGFTDIGNGNEAVSELPAGDYDTSIAAAGTTEPLLAAPVSLEAGSVEIVYAIGSLEDNQVALLQQSLMPMATTDDTAAGGTAADDTAGDDTAADDTAGDDTAAGDTAGDDAAAGDTATDDTVAPPTAISAGNSGLAAEGTSGDGLGVAIVVMVAIAGLALAAALAAPGLRDARRRS